MFTVNKKSIKIFPIVKIIFFVSLSKQYCVLHCVENIFDPLSEEYCNSIVRRMFLVPLSSSIDCFASESLEGEGEALTNSVLLGDRILGKPRRRRRRWRRRPNRSSAEIQFCL